MMHILYKYIFWFSLLLKKIPFRFVILTSSIAIASSRVVQSPRIRNELNLDNTWIKSHLVGGSHDFREFCGSLTQPESSLKEIIKLDTWPENFNPVELFLIGKTILIPGLIGPTHSLHSSSIKGVLSILKKLN